MFYLATPAAAGVVQFWRSLEDDRKHPLKMLRKIGPGSALCYLFGRLSLRNAVQHIGKRSGADAGLVDLSFGRAAGDVDTPPYLDLVRRPTKAIYDQPCGVSYRAEEHSVGK